MADSLRTLHIYDVVNSLNLATNGMTANEIYEYSLDDFIEYMEHCGENEEFPNIKDFFRTKGGVK